MIRITGRYVNQTIQLDRPLNLPDSAEVGDVLREEWAELGMSRLEEEWSSPGDAIYDDWRKLYGVSMAVRDGATAQG